ncbi:MAG: hypothetical protein LBG65_06980 [Puniceicoccales bacterium]|jgi:nucleoside phosphorylase|nr:hypothetical protein [Puniceicoccales bacterium]
MFTVFIPSAFEAEATLRRLAGRRKCLVEGAPVWSGWLGGRPARVCVCGMGRKHSARRIRAVLEALRPLEETDPVWLAGFGGGLDPSLARNALVLLASNESAGASAHVRALERAEARNGMTLRHIACVHTADEVLDTEEKKRAAFERTGAPIVDMESGPFLDLLREFGRNGAVLRVISDDVSEEFPADLIGNAYDFERGRDTPVRFAWHLLTHPGDISRLYRFLSPLGPVRLRLAQSLEDAARGIS